MSSSQLLSSKNKASFVIPAHNESLNIPLIYKAIVDICKTEKERGVIDSYEILFINDGSTDDTALKIDEIAKLDESVKAIHFSRNFGKEAATTAGLHYATGDFIIMLDSDLQHPVELIPDFINLWRDGFDVVVGKIKKSKSSFLKRVGRKVFYYIISKIQDTDIDLSGNDFRLIDRQVVDAFFEFEEQGRSTRNLIDWLGFRRAEIEFTPNNRQHGEASYTTAKLFKLGINSIISNSLFPLKIAGYLGVFIFSVSGLLGVFIFINKYLIDDRYGFRFSYPSILAVVNMFLIGIVLICLGLVALYIGHIRHEVLRRPLYVIKKNRTNLQ